MKAAEVRAHFRRKAVEEARTRARTARASYPPLTVCEVCRPSRVGRYARVALTGAVVGTGLVAIAGAVLAWSVWL